MLYRLPDSPFAASCCRTIVVSVQWTVVWEQQHERPAVPSCFSRFVVSGIAGRSVHARTSEPEPEPELE